MEATPAQIQDWKAKYGEDQLHRIWVTIVPARFEEDKEITPAKREPYIIRVPGRSEVSAVAHHGKNEDSDQANDVLIKNCVLHGNMELIESDGSVFGSVLQEITKLLRKREVEVEKL